MKQTKKTNLEWDIRILIVCWALFILVMSAFFIYPYGAYMKEVKPILEKRCEIRNMSLIDLKLIESNENFDSIKIICINKDKEEYLFLIDIKIEISCIKYDKWRENCVDKNITYSHWGTLVL